MIKITSLYKVYRSKKLRRHAALNNINLTLPDACLVFVEVEPDNVKHQVSERIHMERNIPEMLFSIFCKNRICGVTLLIIESGICLVCNGNRYRWTQISAISLKSIPRLFMGVQHSFRRYSFKGTETFFDYFRFTGNHYKTFARKELDCNAAILYRIRFFL